MLPEPLPETGVLTNQIANFVDGRRRRTLWLFNVDSKLYTRAKALPLLLNFRTYFLTFLLFFMPDHVACGPLRHFCH